MIDEGFKYLISAIIGSWVTIQVSIAVLKVKVDRLEKDVDNIGAILGTEKSKGRKK